MVIYNTRQVELPGRAVVYRKDFETHIDGGDFRHTADDVDMNPPLVNITASNVQNTLQLIETAILGGFDVVSIGDGNQSFGTFSVGGVGYPTVESCFAAALATYKLGTYGGIILVKSGLYNFTTTVSLPAGITVVGEHSGSILNATTANPIFRILEAESFFIKASPPTVSVDGYLQTKLVNLSFFDNFSGASPNLTTATTSCFAFMNNGSSLEVSGCQFFGKFTDAFHVTGCAIRADSSIVTNYNTNLKVENCIITGMQQAITFNPDGNKINKVTFNNNKVMCSGIYGSALEGELSIIDMIGCNAEFCNNDVMFGLSATDSNFQTINQFVYISTPPVSETTMIITGNTLKAKFGAILGINNLIMFDGVGAGADTRSVITGNTFRGTSGDSNSWYIVVGDGADTIGDINGSNALMTIINSLYNDSSSTSLTHNQTTIYVRPGTYEINGASFPLGGGTFDFKLIGLTEYGNYPKLKLNITTPAAGGQNVYITNHIENFYVYGYNNKYYNIYMADFWTNPDSRPIYSRNMTVKNCHFYDCGLKFYGPSTDEDTENAINITIDGCYFSNSAAPTNVTLESSYRIDMNVNCADINITNCYTKKSSFIGNFLTVINKGATYYRNDINIDNCKLYTKKQVASSAESMILITSCRSFRITNSLYDNSLTTVSNYNFVDCLGSTESSEKATFVAENNKIFGYNTLTFMCGFKIRGFTDVAVNNNTFKDTPIGICIIVFASNLANILYSFNFEICKNNFKAGSNSYGLFSMFGTASPATSGIGNVIIKDNNLDMIAKGTSNRSFANYSIATYYSPIFASFYPILLTNSCNIVIENNTIYSFIANDGAALQYESCIFASGFNETIISNNTIYTKNQSSIRYFLPIYSGSGYPDAGYFGNYRGTKISNNSITVESVIARTLETPIYVKDTLYVDVVNNSIRASGASCPTNYIKVFAKNVAASNIGNIKDNTINSDDDSHLALDSAIIYYDTTLASTYNTVRLNVERNKGVKVCKQIDCYSFQQYGYNNATTYPYASAKLLVNNRSIFADANASNLNKTYQMDIATYEPLWVNLPEGVYYSNCYSGGESPLVNFVAFKKHQILIPLNVPNFSKLDSVEIPIYYFNTWGSPVTFSASASLICGNDVDISGISGGPRVNYIKDPATTTDWELNSIVVAGDTGSSFILTNDLSAAISDVYISPKWYSSTQTVAQNLYVVLSLHANRTTDMYFAIPYCKVYYVE